MVEADSHLKLLPIFILDKYKVSLVESKCCQYILIETDSHLKLRPSSILDVYKVFEHIDMLSMGIQ